MEHIPEAGLPQLCGNVVVHLQDQGLWIASVSTLNKPPHHVTVKAKEWWLAMFANHGFENDEGIVSYFGDDWVRGPLQNAPESFHVVLRKKRGI
jgi:hypothetical protein